MPERNPLPALLAILTVAWLLILIGAVIVFNYIVPFSYFHSFADSVAKGVFGTIAALLWLLAMAKMRDLFVRKEILKSNQTADSDS